MGGIKWTLSSPRQGVSGKSEGHVAARSVSFWSALTRQRFGRLRPVAAFREIGINRRIAALSRRRPKRRQVAALQNELPRISAAISSSPRA
jgi:hypothetical protein